MRTALVVIGACLGFVVHNGAAQTTVATIFEIGKPDADYSDLSIAGKHEQFPQSFPRDVEFVVGKSNAKKGWPYIHPGPADDWAGARSHDFKIRFDSPQVRGGCYALTIDYVSTHRGLPPHMVIDVNGTPMTYKLPSGSGDEVLKDTKVGKRYTIRHVFPATLLKNGENTISLKSVYGSWAIYDAIRLESGATAPKNPIVFNAEISPWLKRFPDGSRRVLKFSIRNLQSGNAHAEITWKAGNQSGSQPVEARFGETEAFVNLPDFSEPTDGEFVLKLGGKEFTTKTTIQPVRKWRIYIVPTVHTDIGYTDLQQKVIERHAGNTAYAVTLSQKYPSFLWDLETYWQLESFLELRPKSTDDVFRLLREGRWGLSALYGNELTGLCSHEALNRLTLHSRKLATKVGFDFTSTILDDVPSAVGSLPTVLANSGIKYFIEGVNNDRAPHATVGLPNPFYWEGPDGSRVLSHIGPGYARASAYFTSIERASEQVPQLLAQYENSKYPYDAILINGAFSDNAPVGAWLGEVIEKWDAQWEYPKLILAKPEDYFHYVETNYAGKIPVIKGDFGGWWEDGAASSALETALCRRAEERAVTAEMLHSIGRMLTERTYPAADIYSLWKNVLLYDEHTWGAWCSISQPQSEQTLEQWEVKGSFARQADAVSRQLLKNGMSGLAAMVPKSDLVVFNSLAWTRNDIVPTDEEGAWEDVATGDVLHTQQLPEGGYCFVAKDLPSVGYRTFRRTNAAPVSAKDSKMSTNEMENQFYRVVLDAKTGALKSVFDKETGRELVDAESEYSFGEMIYVSGGEGTYAVHSNLGLPAPKFVPHRSEGTQVERINGPVFTELRSEAKNQNLPKIILHARLYNDIKRLDLNYEFEKTETTAKEAVYVAFPFAFDVNKGGLWLEYPDAIVEPLKDQHATACRDWFPVQRWLAASDGEATAVLSPLDTPLVTLGGMTAGSWLRELSLKKASVFAYVMNNYWHTNYKASQGGRHLFRFSITSMTGAFSKSQSLARGWEMFCPPVSEHGHAISESTLTLAADSFLRVEPATIPLLAFKQAEDENGFICRLTDFGGTTPNVKLTFPAEIKNASACNLVEIGDKEEAANGRTINATLKPFAPTTLKLQFAASGWKPAATR